MSTNEITGDNLVTKISTDKFREGWERIFGNKNDQKTPESVEQKQEYNVSDEGNTSGDEYTTNT